MTALLARHRIDLIALTFGLVFAIEGLAAAAQQLHWIHVHGRTWFGVVAVAIGLAGAIGVTLAAFRPHSTTSGPTAFPPAPSSAAPSGTHR